MESEGEEIIQHLIDYDRARERIKQYEGVKKTTQAKIFDYIGDDYNKVIAGPYTLHCGMVSGKKGTLVTKDMVGKTIGTSEAYRGFKLYEKKEESNGTI